jgi:hypothetical protein
MQQTGGHQHNMKLLLTSVLKNQKPLDGCNGMARVSAVLYPDNEQMNITSWASWLEKLNQLALVKKDMSV